MEEEAEESDVPTFYNPNLVLSASLETLDIEGSNKRVRDEDSMCIDIQAFQRFVQSPFLLAFPHF